MATRLRKEKNLDKQIQKQMGCMAGFLQIFDRHHILTGKRLYSAKRLPALPAVDTTSSEKSGQASPAVFTNLGKPEQSPQNQVAELPPKSSLPLPIFELKQGTRSSWKFSKEAPRLSLDSRATTDAKGSLHPKEIRAATAIFPGINSISSTDTSEGGHHNRSPSVIARLMGLELLPDSSVSEQEKQPELRRSASESRVSKDIFQSRFTTDGSSNYSKQQNQSHSNIFNNGMKNNMPTDAHYADPRNQSLRNTNKLAEPPKGWGASPHRKSFFDSGDVFPEPKQIQSVSIYGEIEKRLRRRGIDEPSKDLETLKQILEALQLKGLLHSKQPPQNHQVRHRNFVYDESSIVLMKPSRSSPPAPGGRRVGTDNWPPLNGKNQTRGVCRNYRLAGETSPAVCPRRERNVRSPIRSGRSSSPTTRSSENNASPSPVSVLDSSFYKDESLTPSPVTTKRSINFEDQCDELEEEIWSPVISPIRSRKCIEIYRLYISDILRALHCLPEESDVFLLLEKQQYLKGNDTSKVSTLQRKLIFDTINEILDGKRRLPPWKAFTTPSLERVWLEFQRIRERHIADDLFEMICGVLKKDLASDAITGWDDCPFEMSGAVLDIERLIFKDLIGEAIWDLGALAADKGTFSSMVMMPRRKLVF